MVRRIGSPAFQPLPGHGSDLDQTLDDLREATLLIVQNTVVNGLKGKVEIASTPGHGTTVTVRLPRVVPDLPVGAKKRVRWERGRVEGAPGRVGRSTGVSSVELTAAGAARGMRGYAAGGAQRVVERLQGSRRVRRGLAVLMLRFIVGCSVGVYVLPLGSAELAVLMLPFIVGCSVGVYLLRLGSAELVVLGYLAVFVSTLAAGMAIMVPGVNVVVFVAGRCMDPVLVAGRFGCSYRTFFLATFPCNTVRFLLVPSSEGACSRLPDC